MQNRVSYKIEIIGMKIITESPVIWSFHSTSHTTYIIYEVGRGLKSTWIIQNIRKIGMKIVQELDTIIGRCPTK
jgi:hypothetical protein